MATFNECLMSAVEQGAISREEAADLDARFAAIFAQKRLELGDGPAAAAAKDTLEKTLKAEAAETRRRVLLTEAAKQNVVSYLTGYKTPKGEADVFEATLNLFESFGGGIVGLRGRVESIVGLAHSQLTDTLQTFRRTAISGRRMNRPAADDLVRELKGEGTGSAEAFTMARAIEDVFESLRQRFNAAGGAIAKLEGWGLPHSHDAAAVLKVGEAAWVKHIKPLLDPGRMKDPLTGEALSPARLDQVLSGAYANIVSNGWANRDPVMQRFGKGALANQRQEHRFLVFKDASAWLDYDRQFGTGDPIVSVFNHINGMARDIASMELLGPNPSAMVEWLKQVNMSEIGKHTAGKPSLYRAGNAAQELAGGTPAYLASRIDQVWQYARGRETLSPGVAAGFGSIRNALTSAYLGAGALTAAATDPFIDGLARHVAGLPVWPAFTAIVDTFRNAPRDQAVRAGIILDDFLHITRDEARFTTISTGAHEWSKWLADRTMTWSGLSPMTQARRHVFALEWMGVFADHARTPFDQIPDRTRARLEAYGITASDWQRLAKVEPYRPGEGSAGLLRPSDIATVEPQVAEKLLGLIYGETERAVPSGTIRSRSIVLAGRDRGSVSGEILESMLQFKSFGLSFTTLQLQAIQGELARGKWNGAAYASALAIGLTIGGAMAIQLGNITQGRDVQPVNDPKFILAALQRGGGFGLFGDFMFADVNRHGNSFGETILGPTLGLVGSIGKATVGNVQELALGKDTKAGREMTQLLRRNTPVASSLWFTRAAYNRVLLDQLQYLTDPDAHKSFGEQRRRYEKETGATFWWQPGEGAPSRAPSFEQFVQ
jgi:hypothetical protein